MNSRERSKLGSVKVIHSTIENMFVLQSLMQKYCSKRGGGFMPYL